MRAFASAFGVALITCPLPGAAQELRNDGYPSTPTVQFQGGFSAGEEAASRFVAPCDLAQLLQVQVLFGGLNQTRTVTLRVYDDSSGTTAVGLPMFGADFALTGHPSELNAIDVSGATIVVPLRFRVGIAFQHAGLPSIAADQDGTIAAASNYIRLPDLPPNWFTSQALGLGGDWILRATVSCPVDVFADGFETPLRLR